MISKTWRLVVDAAKASEINNDPSCPFNTTRVFPGTFMLSSPQRKSERGLFVCFVDCDDRESFMPLSMLQDWAESLDIRPSQAIDPRASKKTQLVQHAFSLGLLTANLNEHITAESSQEQVKVQAPNKLRVA
ncbi:MAG: hypothetical protein AAF988_06300 [Pseudomonadota bacterium]